MNRKGSAISSDEQNQKIESTSVMPLYLLALGVFAGILLGPFVLGRYAPQTYKQLFPAGQAAQLLAEYQQQTERLVEDAHKLGSDSYVPTLIAEREEGFRDLRLAVEKERAIEQSKRLNALILALAILMFFEALLASPVHRFQPGLRIARYALLTLWIALFLSVPWAVLHLPLVFLITVVAVAAIAGIVPMGKRRRTYDH